MGTINRTTTYNNVTGELTNFGTWTIAQWPSYTAKGAAGYTPSQAEVSSATVTDQTPPTTINITYTANQQSVVIKFVDDNDNDAQVGKNITKNGVTNQTIDNLGLMVPDHYQLATGQSLPISYKFKASDNDPIIIHLVHATKTVNGKTPGDIPSGVNKDQLIHTVTRTITDNVPGQAPIVESQMGTITRSATYDEVTGKLSNFKPWTAATLAEYTAHGAAGYTATPAQVSAENVTSTTKDSSVEINYMPNDQSTNIIFKDKAGKTIQTDTVNGKTDQTVDVHTTVPTGWKLVDGQTIPETIKFGPSGHRNVVVQVEHATTPVSHDDPVPKDGKTPTGKPINGAHESDLNQTITRTIIVKTQDGKAKTITQPAKIHRDATYNDFTGEVTYGKWSAASWGSFTPAAIKGYTSNPSEVSAEQVTAGMVDQTITITYQAIPGPKEGQQVVHYVDPDSKVVATQTITGKQGDDVPFTSQIPENWTPVNNVPSTIKITGGTTTILIKHKTTQASDSRTVTQTIVEELPSGPKTETQTATITRAGIKDLVTGEINWDPWTTSQWNKFTPEVPAGYIPSQRVVAQMQVAEKTQDTTVTITYTRIPEPQDGQQIISYQDRDGHVIHTQTVTGKDGDDVSFTPEVPTNWTPAGKVPTTVKIDGSTTVIVIEPKTSQVTDQKTITRKIIEHLPDGHDKTTMQRVTLKI